jgi:hypothetical protein
MSSEDNPYLALREAKIQRNEARLRELGLTGIRGDRARKKRPPTRPSIPDGSIPVRRSQRLSSVTSDERFQRRLRRPRVVPARTMGHIPEKRPVAPKPPLAANSVRGISICAQRLTVGISYSDFKQIGLLGLPLEQTGKEYVISKSFQMAASSEDKLRIGESPRLSFNKYSGVQEWQNCIFLWVNLGAKGPGTVVNEFQDGGTKITWFGGSQMVDDTPVVEKLIRWGREANDVSSKIVLWCRRFDANQKRFHPYVCLGRLSYVSHEPGSQPLAFVWSLLDAQRLKKNDSTTIREYFQQILET